MKRKQTTIQIKRGRNFKKINKPRKKERHTCLSLIEALSLLM